MTTLTRAKKMTRVAGIGLGAAVVAYIFIRITLNIIFTINTNNKLDKQQVQQSQPSVTFGQIAAPQLQPAAVDTTSATLQLDLVNGTFPQSTTSAQVYKVAAPSLSLTAQDRARQRGASLGFSSTPSQPDTNTFAWSDAWRQLSVSLKDQTFSLTSNLPEVDFSQRQTFNQFTSLSRPVGSFVQRLLSYSDIQFTTPQVRYVYPASGSVLPQGDNAVAPTNFAQISFFRQSLNGLPIYSATGKFGPINLVVIPPMKSTNSSSSSSGLKLDQIVQFTSQYFPIERDSASLYPIINPQTAYNQLQLKLKQYLVSVEPNGVTLPTTFQNGRVLFTTLVYLEPDVRNTQYVQPAWMFEGRGTTNVGEAKWIAFVPAIDQTKTNQLINSK